VDRRLPLAALRMRRGKTRTLGAMGPTIPRDPAHDRSSNHRAEILRSEKCGCFYCLNIFAPTQITEWCDEAEDGVGQTALCPFCGVDSVIGSASGYALDQAFLKSMKNVWFR